MSEKNCGACRYVYIGKAANDSKAPPQHACRRHPPQTHFIVVLRKVSALQPTMQPIEEQRSAFPAVMPDWSCGEWAPRLEMSS